MLTAEEEKFAISLMDQCNADEREKWLSIMRFGMGTLIQNPKFLIDVICQRAKQEHEEKVKPSNWTVGEIAGELLDYLGLSFVEGEAA